MSRQRKITEWYVRVEPRGPGNFGCCIIGGIEWEDGEEEAACREILEQIKRHVDKIGRATVLSETEDVCEHCGSAWTEGEASLHNGGCCDADCAVLEAEATP